VCSIPETYLAVHLFDFLLGSRSSQFYAKVAALERGVEGSSALYLLS
jgi:hypothetical protein